MNALSLNDSSSETALTQIPEAEVVSTNFHDMYSNPKDKADEQIKMAAKFMETENKHMVVSEFLADILEHLPQLSSTSQMVDEVRMTIYAELDKTVPNENETAKIRRCQANVDRINGIIVKEEAALQKISSEWSNVGKSIFEDLNSKYSEHLVQGNDLSHTNTFLETMHLHETVFHDKMRKHIDLSAKIKSLTYRLSTLQVKKTFWALMKIKYMKDKFDSQLAMEQLS